MYFSLNLRPPRESSLGFGTIKASFWRCTKLLPEFFPVCVRTEAILGEIFSTSASLPELSLEARPPREFSLGFGTIKASFWRRSGLLPGVSPVFDRTKTTLGEIFPPSLAFQSSLWKRVPPVSSLSGLVPSRHLFGAVAVYYQGSLQHSIVQKLLLWNFFPSSPAFQSSLWKRVPPVSSLSGLVPSRHRSGTVAVYYRGSLQYSIVQKLLLGKSFPPSPAFQSSLWMRVPPVSSLSGSVPSRHLFGAVAVYYRGSLQYSIVQKLFLGNLFPHSSAFQSSLWKRVPPVSSLSGSVPSRHLFGAVVIYYQRSFQYSIVQKLLLGSSFPLTPAFQRSLWKCVLPVSSLSSSVPSRHLFGTVVNYYRWSLQYSIVQKLFLGTYFPHTPAFQRSLWKCAPPVKFSLGFGTIKASFWRCTKLLPEVSPIFDCTDAIFGKTFPTYDSLPEVSPEMRPPREFFLGFGTIKASFWRCTMLLPEVSIP